MAGSGEGASVANQGLLAILRGLRCAVEAEVSFAEAARAGRISLAEPVPARSLLKPCGPDRWPPRFWTRDSCG